MGERKVVCHSICSVSKQLKPQQDVLSQAPSTYVEAWQRFQNKSTRKTLMLWFSRLRSCFITVLLRGSFYSKYVDNKSKMP